MASKLKTFSGVALVGGLVAAVVTAIALRADDVPTKSGAPRASVKAESSEISPPALRSPASVASSATERSGAEVSKPLRTLNEIMASHADSDPRLDTELLHLDEPTKKLFRRRYESIEREQQNDRGTIVFLLGRNIASFEDVQFLISVLKEKPCLSLENCDTPAARTNSHEAPSDISLVYAQAVTLVSFEKFLTTAHDASLKSAVIESVRSARQSHSATIARLSDKLVATFDRTTK